MKFSARTFLGITTTLLVSGLCAPIASAEGAALSQFASRANVTSNKPMYGAFVLNQETKLFIAVRGPSLKTLGIIPDPLLRPRLELYSQAGQLITASNQCGGATPESQLVVSYYRDVRQGALDSNDACLTFSSTPLPAGVYTFVISADSSSTSSSGEVLFETTPAPDYLTSTTPPPTLPTADLSSLNGTDSAVGVTSTITGSGCSALGIQTGTNYNLTYSSTISSSGSNVVIRLNGYGEYYTFNLAYSSGNSTNGFDLNGTFVEAASGLSGSAIARGIKFKNCILDNGLMLFNCTHGLTGFLSGTANNCNVGATMK